MTNPLRASQTEAVAYGTTDLFNGDITGEVAATLGARGSSSNAAGPTVAVAFAIQERAVCENPDAGPDGVGVRDDNTAYTLEARTRPQAVAFVQNQRDEVRLCNGDGDIVGALAKEHGAKQQQHYIAFTAKDHGQDATEDIAPTLRAMQEGESHVNGGGQVAVAAITTLAIRGRGDSHNLETRDDGTANAVLTPNGGRGGIGVGAIHTGMQVRRLTPRECERLQGFPDDHTLIPVGKKLAADGPRYKALGNSMAVPVMRWIGQRLHDVLTMI